jgi:WD40 repeat protein
MNSLANPYVGPRTFEKTESDRFFGRERETRELLTLTVSEQLVLFYAQSGAGKSSLVNTRLIPDLERKGFLVLPVGRVGGDPPSELNVDNIYVFNLIRKAAASEVRSISLARMSLCEFLSDRQYGFVGEGIKSPNKIVLVIDQFEELFSTHPQHWTKREDFFLQLAQAMQEIPYLWVVLVMREDYIASLEPYEHLLPGRLRMRYYMQRLGRDAALKAIKRPAEKLRAYAPGVAEKLVDDLSGIRTQHPDGTTTIQPGQFVEPVQLQVVCYNLWEGLDSDGEQITDDDLQKMGDVSQALEKHYARRVEAVATQYAISERAIREWFEKKLISSSGTRTLILHETHKSQDDLSNELIQALQSDLVRAEKRGSSTFYELTHDRLVEPILANNRKWNDEHFSVLQKQAALWDQQRRPDGLLLRGQELINAENESTRAMPSETELAFLNACRRLNQIESREKQHRRLLTFLTMSAILAMIAAVFFAWQSQTLAANAQEAEKEALRQRDLAESSQATAQASNQMAEERLIRSDSLRFALQSKMLLLSDVNANPELAALLSIRSLKGVYVPEADAALVESMDRLYAVYTFQIPKNEIKSLAVSQNGQYFATGGTNSTAQVWDMNTGQLLGTYKHDNWVNSVAFSPDSKYLVTGSYDKTAKVWDLSTGQMRHVLDGHDGTVLGVAYSPDGRYILTGSGDQTAKLWDSETGKELLTLTGHEDMVWDVAFSHSGNQALTGSEDKTVKLWNLKSGVEEYTFTGFNKVVYSVAFSPDDEYIAAAGAAVSAFVWDRESHLKQFELEHFNSIDEVRFSNDGKYILTGSFDDTAKLWDAETGKNLRTYYGHTDWIQGVAFTADNRFVFTGGHDSTVKAWLTSASRLVNSFKESESMREAAFSPDGKFVVVGNRNDHAYLWSIETGRPKFVFDEHTAGVESVAFSRDGKYVVTGSLDKTAKLWDTNSGKELQTYSQHSDAVWAVAISPDSQYVLTGSADSDAILWETLSGKIIKTFAEHTVGITAVAFSPDGKLILTGSQDNTAKLWDLETGNELLSIKHVQDVWGVTFSPDGKKLLTGSLDGTAKLWDAQSGAELHTFQSHGDRITGVAFSSDGTMIVTGNADHTASLWDVSSGEEIRVFAGHTDFITGVAISPDDKLVVTTSDDGTVRVWDLDVNMTIKKACSILTRDLTDQERIDFQIANSIPACSEIQKSLKEIFGFATLDDIEELIKDGKISEALTLLETTREINPSYIEAADAVFWNRFCWWGNLYGFARDVTDSCNRAVELDPGNVWQDGRGINRALLGDYAGALADFKIAVIHFEENGWSQYYIDTRKEWIAALEAGQNPFDAELLAKLKEE